MLASMCKIAGLNCAIWETTPQNAVLETKFNQHIAEFGLMYHTTAEYQFRLDLFKETDETITAVNAENTSFTLGHNQFSSYTKMEKKRMMGKKEAEVQVSDKIIELDTTSIPTSEDWRTKGAVNPVQNQGGCGSCWAFSATAAMEGDHFIQTGKLLKLSEQQFVDCDTQSSGCQGGLEMYAFEYAEKHAQELEKDYKYTAKDGSCKADSSKGVVSAKTYAHVPSKSADQLLAAIAVQPTCVSVDAEDSQFMYYTGGILNTKTCGTNLDHAVTAVGYGVEDGQRYFIVRNSWGNTWGEKGYIRMSADVGGNGVCGVLLDSTRPTTN